MAREERVLIASLGVGLAFLLLNGLREVDSPQDAAGSTGPEAVLGAPRDMGKPAVAAKGGPTAGPSYRPDLEKFGELLGMLRRNDESVLPAMRDLVERLCTTHERCDGQDILAFYESMSAEGRARGVEEEARFLEIKKRVLDRFDRGHLDEEWYALREEAVAELDAIVERSTRQPDVFPGACAASFRSRLETSRLLTEYTLDPEEREDLLESARGDALASLESLGRCGMLTPRLQPMWLLGYLHLAEGETIEARKTFEDCLELARRVRDVDWQEIALQGLVDLAREAGDTHEITVLLDEISRIRKPDESWYLVREQATVLLQQDQIESTARWLLAHPPADPTDRREWRILLGGAFLRQGDLTAAREQFALADPLPFSQDVALGMAAIELRAGNAEMVLAQVSKPEFLSGIYPFEETLALQIRGEAAFDLGRFSEAVTSLERALRIGTEIQDRLVRQRDLVGAATSVVGEGTGLHSLALLAEARASLGEHLEAARAIENWQSRTLRLSSDAEITAEDLLAWARSTDLGLVTWVVGSNSSAVAHVAPDGSALAVPIRRGRRAIESAVRRLNEAVLGTQQAFAERLAAEIGAEILPTAISTRIASLRGSERKRLLVLVHGPLERLPIEFLFRADGVIPLVLPGLPSREPGAALSPRDLTSWSILGGPVDLEGRPLLAGAQDELSEIAALLATAPVGTTPEMDRSGESVVQAGGALAPGSKVRVGAAFDRAALVEALRGGGPLHVATHLARGCGEAAGRLADIGLELSGGDVLCAREIAEVGPRSPLAVLAACATAEGRFLDAEGLQGIARTFLESGTRNLLVTLWPVEDQAAREFALDFHRALAAGKRPSEAADLARARLRSSGRPAADWAAFRLIGRD